MDLMFDKFVQMDMLVILQVVMLGFIGGVLSGFIGSGGAFFMTPGMMNLGVPGVIAVGSNITHKFGKALMGSKKHGEMGNVDRRLGIFLLASACAGIFIAAQINKLLFAKGGSHGEGRDAVSNLYISMVFVCILSFVGYSMLRDALRSRKEEGGSGPSMRIADMVSKFRMPPYISFPVADVRVSLWPLLAVGLATGYLAGTIGVGGFIGVPAMIYVFGVPTAVAAGTELYLAMYMGAWGALNYAYMGCVDIRMTLALYLGSLVGIYVGAYGTKVVKEVYIRITTGTIILLCVISRLVAVPMYLRQMGWVEAPEGWDPVKDWDYWFNTLSKGMLYIAGLSGALMILWNVIRAYFQRRRIQRSLHESRPGEGAVQGGIG